ncbi:MAG: hypothetical protein J6252_03730, partial [Clostridia bacterium]|nr:hypothetical protein [Clostridia bacterium]
TACGGRTVEEAANRKIAGKQAGNDAVDFSFAYPEEWELGDNDGRVSIRLDCNKSDAIAQYASISVTTFTLSDSSVGARDYWNGYKKDLAATLKDFTVLNESAAAETSAAETSAETGTPSADGKEITLGGTVALKVRYSGKVTERTYLFDQIICCRNGAVYLVTFTATNDDYDTAKSALDVVQQTFVFN